MLAHINTLVWVRFRIFSHSFSTQTERFSHAVVVVARMGLVLIAVGVAVGAYWGGLHVGSSTVKANGDDAVFGAFLLMAVCDGAVGYFVLMWVIALVTELQRGEMIDFRRMLYLPVSLRTVFLLNFSVSLFSPALAFFVLPLVAFCIATSTKLGPQMLLGIPIGLILYAMLASWTYYVRGILMYLMENKRRRRLIVVLLPFVFILPALAPQAYRMAKAPAKHTAENTSEKERPAEEAESATLSSQLSSEGQRRAQKSARTMKVMHYATVANGVIPLAWLPLSLKALADGQGGIALQCSVALVALAGLGLALGYRSTQRFYQGTSRSKGKRIQNPKKARRLRPGRRRLIEWDLPLASDDVSGVALAGFLSYARHPIVWAQLLMPLVGAWFILNAYVRLSAGDQNPWSQLFVASTPMLITMLPFVGYIVLFTNIFGLDPGGFRAYVLLPVDRKKYILGKNLALFAIPGILAAFFVLCAGFMIGLPFSAFIIALMQVIQLHLVFCLVGNVTSIYFPYRIKAKGQKLAPIQQIIVMVAGLVVLSVLGLLMLPSALAMTIDAYLATFRDYHGVSVGLLVSVATLLATVLVYRTSLTRMGELLQQKEQKILETLVRDKE